MCSGFSSFKNKVLLFGSRCSKYTRRAVMFGLFSPHKFTMPGIMSDLALLPLSRSKSLFLSLLKIHAVQVDVWWALSSSQKQDSENSMSVLPLFLLGQYLGFSFYSKMSSQTNHVSDLLSSHLKVPTEQLYACSGSLSFFQNQYLDFYFYSNMATTLQCVKPALSSFQNSARAFPCLFWLFLFVLDQMEEIRPNTIFP
jgi:hypothetical protein